MRFASLALIVLFILAAGCGTPTPAATPTAVPTPTPAATATPLPGEVLLVTDGVTDPELLSSAQETLTRLASGSGFTLKVLPTATPADLAPQVVVAVFLAPPADLANLLTTSPQTQFVVVSPVDLPSCSQFERCPRKSGELELSWPVIPQFCYPTTGVRAGCFRVERRRTIFFSNLS